MRPALLAASALALTLTLAVPAQAAPSPDDPAEADPSPRQPAIGAREKPVLFLDELAFRDLNASGGLDAYEDWRLPVDRRVEDLLARMTLAEKAGMMLIATHNPACNGQITTEGLAMIEAEHMSRFILRASVVSQPADCSIALSGFAARRGYEQTPRQMAGFTNAVQQAREATKLGIPALFKDNARNHVETNALFGIAQGAGIFSQFPKEAGLAAAALGAGAPPTAAGDAPEDLRADMRIIAGFSEVMGQEWRAIGLRGMYGYMADLATEPR